MILVFDHVARRSHQASQDPLFVHLRNPEGDALEKLVFVPWAAHFAMTFADLYEFFRPAQPACDSYEEAANTNLFEDVTHWRWYLADLKALGLDPNVPFTEVLRFVWGDQTIDTRRFAYEMCKLCARLRSLDRLVMVNALEATGRVMFQSLVPARERIERHSERRLQYFGKLHLDTERKHTLEDTSLRACLDSIALDGGRRAQLVGLVDHVFDHFRGFTDGLFRVVQGGRRLSEELRAAPIDGTVRG